MTAVQIFGLFTICALLGDLVSWMQWSRAPQSQRSRQFRRALLGVGYVAMWGGVWAFLQFAAGARPDGPGVPWWIAACVVLGALMSLGLSLWELRRIMSMRHVGA